VSAVPARFICDVCDGFLVKGPAAAKCRCPLPERDDIPTLTRVNGEWVIERGTAPDTGWPRVAA
jgi:hypothetical protein